MLTCSSRKYGHDCQGRSSIEECMISPRPPCACSLACSSRPPLSFLSHPFLFFRYLTRLSLSPGADR
eukprot:599697-Hanusia_phi.AAC.1